MDKKVDTKCHYPLSSLWVVGSSVPTTLTALGASFDPCTIQRYDDGASTDKDKCRLGDTIKIKRISMRGVVSDLTQTVNTVRLMVVRWANNDFSDIDVNSVLQHNATNGAPWSMIDHNCPYQILMDKRIQIGTTAGSFPTKQWSWNKTFKSPLTVAYDPAAITTTSYSDIQKGLIRVYACCNAGTTCTLKYTWEVLFTDV